MSHLRVAVAQHEADSLLDRRKYWYKPVAMVGGQAYSISEGEALPFKLGKRIIASKEDAARGRGGFLLYECAARALQAALVRPKGKLATATKAVLRVTASRACAPADAKWPTAGGVWAYEVITPISIALESQTWMEDPSLASLWLPASPPGLCKQCALGERTCVQVRNRLEMGAPPAKGKSTSRGGACSASGSRDPKFSSQAATTPVCAAVDEWAPPSEQSTLDARAFM